MDSIPNYTEFTALFDVYRIESIHIKWNPEYTVLSDSSLASSALNTYFNSAIDLTDANAPSSVSELLEYSTVKNSSITKEHTRKWKPTNIMSNGMPCHCWLACDSPSERHFGIKVAVPPTGTPMMFRPTITYVVRFASSR